MSYPSLRQGMVQQLFLDISMEACTHIQWRINLSKRYSHIILFHMVSDMERILSQQVMIKKLPFMMHLVMFCNVLTTLMMIKLRTLLSVISIHQEKVSHWVISTDFMFTTSTKREDSGNKSSARTFKTITL